MKTSEKIKLLRLRKGLTQEELGNAVGVQKAAINKYETGRVINIKRTTLQNLANALGVTPAELLDDSDETVGTNARSTVAAVEPSDGWTEEELKEINEFKSYLLHRRNTR